MLGIMNDDSPNAPPQDSTQLANATGYSLVRDGAWLGLWALWILWFLSLYMAPVLLFAFDSEVSLRDGAILGAIQATWVAGIPVVLLVVGHLFANGRRWPRWRARWWMVLGAVLVWCGIVAFWLWAATVDDAEYERQTITSISARS